MSVSIAKFLNIKHLIIQLTSHDVSNGDIQCLNLLFPTIKLSDKVSLPYVPVGWEE